MHDYDLLQYCLSALQKAGIQKAQCLLHRTDQHELNVSSNTISLLRTTSDTTVRLTGILDDRKGEILINQLEPDALDRAVEEVVALARGSEADPAYDIAEHSPPGEFHAGPEEPQLELMYEKLAQFLAYCQSAYPHTIQEELHFSFFRQHSLLQNSHGVDFRAHQGWYQFRSLFTSKEGSHTSSFNTAGFSSRDLEWEIQEYGSVDQVLRQSHEQTITRPLERNLVGDLIITPACLGDFLESITSFLKDSALIAGTSIFKDHLGEAIADPKFTLHSRPVSPNMAPNYFFTNDGYEALDTTIIDEGVLQTFLLSQYGASKTGRTRAVNDGGLYVVDPGTMPLEKMIASTRKGVLLCRFSGGRPGKNGDFSGVAKNSYYIEQGEIQYPLSETMIAGNLGQVLLDISQISREQVDFGYARLPWVRTRGVTISGK